MNEKSKHERARERETEETTNVSKKREEIFRDQCKWMDGENQRVLAYVIPS